MANPSRHTAMLWESLEDQQVRCGLCNFRCRIKPGERGHCLVRENVDGKLYTLNYSAVCSVNVDPIEKKPLFHFYPGSRSLSYAAPGCNFRCDFCQNWQISQEVRMSNRINGQTYSPKQLVEAALESKSASIAHTYTEPTIYFELAYDTAKLAHEQGLRNVFVSNGYMSSEAIERIKPYLDGINVDLKSFSDDFYRQRTGARLAPVLESLKHIVRQSEIWLEVTTLIIPTANDSEEELSKLAKFIVEELGPDVPWHVSRFHPDYETLDLPPTPVQTLKRAREIGLAAGLRYVYCGNILSDKSESTFCYACGKELIRRQGYSIQKNIVTSGKCPHCNAEVAGKGMDRATGADG